MIRTVIKLAVVALIANGAWQLFNAYSPHYKFKDAVTATTQYRGEKSDAQVRDRILELAAEFDVPVTDENLTVRQQDKHTIVESSYVRPIALLPGYTYPWPFSIHVDTYTLKAPTGEELIPK
jgi:hypothetical protein